MKVFLIIIVVSLFFSLTFGQNSKSTKDAVIGKVNLYKFEPTDAPPFIIPHRINLNQNTKIEAVLDTLINVLNNYEYFKKDKISFEIAKLEEIQFSNRIFRIGIVNILDKGRVALTKQFQGSTGGGITNTVILSNLVQPQLYDPILDGLILSYNGDAFEDMDHVNFNKIITESDIFHLVKQAISKSKK